MLVLFIRTLAKKLREAKQPEKIEEPHIILIQRIIRFLETHGVYETQDKEVDIDLLKDIERFLYDNSDALMKYLTPPRRVDLERHLSNIYLNKADSSNLLEYLNTPAAPTEALKDLMNKGGFLTPKLKQGELNESKDN